MPPEESPLRLMEQNLRRTTLYVTVDLMIIDYLGYNNTTSRNDILATEFDSKIRFASVTFHDCLPVKDTHTSGLPVESIKRARVTNLVPNESLHFEFFGIMIPALHNVEKAANAVILQKHEKHLDRKRRDKKPRREQVYIAHHTKVYRNISVHIVQFGIVRFPGKAKTQRRDLDAKILLFFRCRCYREASTSHPKRDVYVLHWDAHEKLG